MRNDIVIDPLGNEVHLPASMCDEQGNTLNEEDIFDNVHDVINRPALIFRMKDGKVEHYYYRAIGWHTTMLVGVTKADHHFEANHCILNPSTERLAELSLNGEQLL